MAPVMQHNTQAQALLTYAQSVLDDAKRNRVQLETRWQRNYEAYEARPERETTGPWKKREKAKAWKSDTVSDITRQKITTAHGLAFDIIGKGGRVPFMLDPLDSVKSEVAGVSQQTGEDLAVSLNMAVEQAQAEITEQMRKTKALRFLSRCLMSGAIYGEYIAKRFEMSVEEIGLTAAIDCVSVWDCWYDREMEDHREWSYVFQRGYSKVSDIFHRAGTGPFIISAIETIVDQRKGQLNTTAAGVSDSPQDQKPRDRDTLNRSRGIEEYEGWLEVPLRMALDLEASLAESDAIALGINQEDVAAEISMADADGITADDESVTAWVYVRWASNVLYGYQREPGEHPFYREVWDEAIDDIGGRGVADNMRFNHRALTGAIRSFEDNTKLLSNFMVATKDELLRSRFEDAMTEGGVVKLDADCDDVRKAVQQFVFQDITGPLTKAIEMFLSLSDLSSHVPRVEQGQQSMNPQTAFELQQRLEKSGKYLGAVIQRFDGLIEWVAKSYLDVNRRNPSSPAAEIGLAVRALGFTSFENRYLRLQKLLQMLTLALQSPTLAAITHIKWLWAEIAKAQDLEPDQLVKSDSEIQAEQAAAAESAAGPAPSPADEDKKSADADRARADAEAKRAKIRLDGAKVAGDLMMKRHQVQRGMVPAKQEQPAGAPEGGTKA